MAFFFPQMPYVQPMMQLFTMIVSTFSMWTFRFALSYVFALYLHMGVIGVWWAMIVDWIF